MRHIKLYEAFKSPKVLYRNTVFEWLSEFLEKGVSLPRDERKYISFSKHENSGDIDEFGDIRIDFDAAELYKQGALDVEYTTEFFKKFPEVCMYVTGYKRESDWVADEMSWEEYVKSFRREEEVILKKLKMKPGLIKKVTIWDADERDDIPQIREMLKLYNIKVEVPWEQTT